jgi:hypothetical protein
MNMSENMTLWMLCRGRPGVYLKCLLIRYITIGGFFLWIIIMGANTHKKDENLQNGRSPELGDGKHIVASGVGNSTSSYSLYKGVYQKDNGELKENNINGAPIVALPPKEFWPNKVRPVRDIILKDKGHTAELVVDSDSLLDAQIIPGNQYILLSFEDVEATVPIGFTDFCSRANKSVKNKKT